MEIRFRRSDEYRIYVYERQTDSQASGAKLRAVAPGHFRIAAEESLTSAPTPAPPPPSHDASWLFQTRVLADRYAKLIAADRKNLLILLLQAPVIGAVLLLAARPSALHMSTSTNGRLLLFLLSVVAVWFGVINSVREITKEAEIYRRERLASLRIPAYLLSKFGVLAGLCAVQSLVLMVLLLLRVDFAADYVALTEYGLIDMTRQPRSACGAGCWSRCSSPRCRASGSGFDLDLGVELRQGDEHRAAGADPPLVFALALMPLPAVLAPISYLTGALGHGVDGLDRRAARAARHDHLRVPGRPAELRGLRVGRLQPAPGHIGLVWIVLAVYTLACLLLTAWMLRRRDAADK
ncbi:hypothetical protein [Nannocystis pusilla]|uniref:hypothetical protein n=1 Tax=Nannocystis pusilla TaxID=889268 RepID=UPI003B7D8A33